ncbi:hypothetical protein HS125_06265 [bacterium]|nr:hypothetical protein [bacterium]
MSAVLHFARVEWLMHRRSLRAWLLFVLLVFLSRYFFMHLYGQATGAEGWRRVGGTLAAWALDPIGAALLLSGLFFAIDAAGWAERPAYREILFPRPFSNGAMVLGRFLGIYAVLVIACLAPLGTLAALVGLPGGPSLDWGAYAWMLAHVWLPGLAVVVAAALWIRGLVPSTLGAGVVALAGWSALMYLSIHLPDFSLFHVPLERLRAATGYTGGAGLLLLSRPLWGWMAVELALTALFLAAAALALDRTGRRVAPRGVRWWQTPTLRSLALAFWPGSSPGKTALALLGFGAGALLALAGLDYRQYRAHLALTHRLEAELAAVTGGDEVRRVGALEGVERLILSEPPAPALVASREIDLRFDPATGHLSASAALGIRPATGEATMLFLLNPGLVVESAQWSDGRNASFTRRFNQLEVNAPDGVEATLTVAYHGKLLMRHPDSVVLPAWKRYQPATAPRRFVHLDAALGWFPEPAAIARRGLIAAHEAAPPEPAPFLVRAEGVRGLSWVAGGDEPTSGAWQSHGPARDLGAYAGAYQVVEGTMHPWPLVWGTLPLRLYHFLGGAQRIIYLWDKRNPGQRDGPVYRASIRFPRLSVVETPDEAA